MPRYEYRAFVTLDAPNIETADRYLQNFVAGLTDHLADTEYSGSPDLSIDDNPGIDVTEEWTS